MSYKLGEHVQTTHAQGRIYQKHHNFKEVGESNEWFLMQQPPLNKTTKEETWYSILILNGGSIVCPESSIQGHISKLNINNKWESFFF